MQAIDSKLTGMKKNFEFYMKQMQIENSDIKKTLTKILKNQQQVEDSVPFHILGTPYMGKNFDSSAEELRPDLQVQDYRGRLSS